MESALDATDLDHFVASVRALDRVLLWNYYQFPLAERGGDRIVYWDKFGRPELPDGMLVAPFLLESEFFGHEKGAYTGALSRRKGYFEEADGSTLFLDEIGELDFSLQAKLLRVVETQEIRPVGSSSTQSVDVRIIAATNRNFHDEINAGRFREDLFYRLAELEVTVPPLRERISDISLLVDWFLDEIKAQVNSNVVELDREAYRLLVNHDWPGNVRELRNVLSRAALVCEGSVIHARHLDFGSRLHADQNQEKQPPRYITDPDVIQRILNHIEAQPQPIKVIDHPKGQHVTMALS